MRKIILLQFLIIACNNPKGDQKEAIDSLGQSGVSVVYEGKPITPMLSEKPSSEVPIFFVSEDCAVLLQLTDAESDSLENEGDENYGDYVDDMNSSTMSAYELIDSLGIVTHTVNSRYIGFVNISMDTMYLNTRKTDDYLNGGYILFNKKKEPIIVYSDTIEESLLRDFFEK